jgi:hypothetical protein
MRAFGTLALLEAYVYHIPSPQVIGVINPDSDNQ